MSDGFRDSLRREEAVLAALRTWFQGNGYESIQSRYDAQAFGNRVEEFAGHALSIRITKDRSQWIVEIKPDHDKGEWQTLEPWSLCIGAPALFHDPRPALTDAEKLSAALNSWLFEPQVTYLKTHLKTIEAACDPNRIDSALQCLDAARNVVRLSEFLRRPAAKET